MSNDEVSRHDERQLLGRLLHIQGEVDSLDRQIERANRLASLGMIVGIIAHELNNILTPMGSYAQMALKNPDDSNLVQKALKHAATGSGRGGQIIEAILGFVRETEESESCEVSAALNDALNCLARDPSRDGFELAADIEPDCRVALAPVLMVQVFVNLMLNAYQAMRKGSGRLLVKAWKTGGKEIRITVSDNGCGIEPELLPAIFEPFTTYRNRPNAGESGTGLGLTVCRRIVNEVGGSIEVDSVVGRGTTFTIMLPAARGNESVADKQASTTRRDVA